LRPLLELIVGEYSVCKILLFFPDDFISVSLIGGYEDERGIACDISRNLIDYFFQSELNFSIEILAIGELNTDFTK